MIRDSLKYIGYFVLLIVLQVFVLNNVQYSGYINPMIYLLFILILPFEIKGLFLLVVAFLTGLTVDLFMNTLGMHTSATVVMAFTRPYVISFLSRRTDLDFKGKVIMGVTGVQWYVKYTIILVFVHHIFLFYFELFSFNHFFLTLLRVLLSTFFSSIVILTAQYFTVKKK
ncbi:MAG TPA: rod shape-determining protein MreD [Tenuifilaceae bacterium]|nr:rod shape-determining protein MreD [Tenuifilaceae bacterium]HPE17829.1 rod shape-determining protein MreD [Tenuifilaceae bacterium]HPJ45273.1 rod shape-determining protein MreD [Tenuifilaceae bacterium]HPQ33621.1 rod shape-determining protein MreD [Tenuifilaceae bacterium]